MVTNGLSQVTGDDADTTRKALAKEVGSRDLTDTKEWSAQPLAMVTNGLRQVAGDDADTTRKALAKEVGRRDLTDPKEWSAPASGHGDQWPESGGRGTTPTRPGRRWPKRWEDVI